MCRCDLATRKGETKRVKSGLDCHRDDLLTRGRAQTPAEQRHVEGSVMAELEIDQSSLPKVQEVRQNFAVLEDGVLAHNLQEQEIEQYYTTNIQKNKLVQNDIRVAKSLQDEEEKKQRAVLRQTSRQTEEEDFEYARIIQEEIQRRAEEVRRREQDDEEIAKRLQEEEERMRSSSSGSEEHGASISGSSSNRNTHAEAVEAQLPSSATRRHYSTSRRHSRYYGGPLDDPRNYTSSWSNEEHFPPPRHEFRDSLSSDSEDLESFLSELSSRTVPQRRASSYHPQERRHKSRRSYSEIRERPGGPQEGFEDGRENMGGGSEQWSRRHNGRDGRSHRESVRIHDGRRDLSRTWSYRDSPDKHVHFQESTRHGEEGGQVWAMLGQVLKERGVPVRLGSSGAPLKIDRRGRDVQGSEASYQQPQKVFQRAASTRHSTHGDPRERRRRTPQWEDSRGGDRTTEERESSIVERRGSRSWRGWTNRLGPTEPEEESDQRAEVSNRRAPRRSHSMRSNRSKVVAAGASHRPEPAHKSLDLRELQQVLQDEELARELQVEEERVLRRKSHPPPSRPFPGEDFRVAQVAQDEEIARFMQKQEIKSKRRSRELEGPGSWRDHRATVDHHDRSARERAPSRVVRGERHDSEGTWSPTEDCDLDQPPRSPTSTVSQSQQIRNVAEELDPTFQARRQSADILTEPTGLPRLSPPVTPTSTPNFLEEPTFIPPTKRQTDKPGRSKPKEKRENCKQQ